MIRLALLSLLAASALWSGTLFAALSVQGGDDLEKAQGIRLGYYPSLPLPYTPLTVGIEGEYANVEDDRKNEFNVRDYTFMARLSLPLIPAVKAGFGATWYGEDDGGSHIKVGLEGGFLLAVFGVEYKKLMLEDDEKNLLGAYAGVRF